MSHPELSNYSPTSLWLNIDSILVETLNSLTEIADAGTGNARLDARLAEVMRRAFADYERFETLGGTGEGSSIDDALSVLGEIEKGLSSLRPIALGLQFDSDIENPGLSQLLKLAKDVSDESKSWRQTAMAVRAVADAQDAASQAASAAFALKTAAGDEGATKLEEAFVAYADQEHASAKTFRFWTVILLIAVAVFGGLLVILQAFVPGQTEVSWQGVIYRVALLTALAGLAAYLGRQSGHPRRAATWADAIAVQLKAFPAFIQPIQGGKVADEIYEAFGKRVMGSPPDFAGKSDDAMNPTMSALIDALVKQARPTY